MGSITYILTLLERSLISRPVLTPFHKYYTSEWICLKMKTGFQGNVEHSSVQARTLRVGNYYYHKNPMFTDRGPSLGDP